MTDSPISETPEVQPLTLDLVTKTINEVVHGAISKRLKSLENLESRLSERLQASPQQEEAKESKPQESPGERNMRLKLEKLESKLAAKEQETRNAQAYNKVRDFLSPHLRPEALDIAAKHIFKAEQLVSVDEDGAYWGVNKQDLDEGLTSWLSSKDALVFKPAPNASAAKTNNVRSPLAARPVSQGASREEKLAALSEEFKAF